MTRQNLWMGNAPPTRTRKHKQCSGSNHCIDRKFDCTQNDCNDCCGSVVKIMDYPTVRPGGDYWGVTDLRTLNNNERGY